uniref:C2H2-type domain-containing protein n=1 Tax=viral metagenome TaxID=1070528 RepID=A0A6C0KR03_9ZZZZ
MKQSETNFTQFYAPVFSCKDCDFNTCKKNDYERHLQTKKHKWNKNETKAALSQKSFSCLCGKLLTSRTSLWRHKQKCDNFNNDDNNFSKHYSQQEQLLDYLMKENSEFKTLMIEQNKQMIELAKNSGNNNNNTINNSFNINVFLNETCKNAMNIMDFVNQLNVSSNDLEETGRLGFAEGISKIFINGLKNIDIPDRPIHCSDFKRETLYIKDEDQWNKETDDKIVLTKAIKHVAHKNMKQIKEWTKDHPEFNNSESKQNDKYLNIVKESMSGSSQEETNKNYLKIIKNIVKETVIDK